MAKSKPFDMGEFLPDKIQLEARLWCIRSKIYISPTAINEGRWGIIIQNNDKQSADPNTYTKNVIWEKIYEYYKYYYNKYENKI